MNLDPTDLARPWKSNHSQLHHEDEDVEKHLLARGGPDFDAISQDHQEAIEESLETFRQIRLIGVALIFDYVIRTNVFVLYAQTFDDCPSTSIVAIIIYLNYLSSGLLSLCSGFIGDYWRFDYLLVIAAILDGFSTSTTKYA